MHLPTFTQALASYMYLCTYLASYTISHFPVKLPIPNTTQSFISLSLGIMSVYASVIVVLSY